MQCFVYKTASVAVPSGHTERLYVWFMVVSSDIWGIIRTLALLVAFCLILC